MLLAVTALTSESGTNTTNFNLMSCLHIIGVSMQRKLPFELLSQGLRVLCMLMPQDFFKNELIDVRFHFRKASLEYDAENAFIILTHLHSE